MFVEPRNWKWIVTGILAPFFAWAAMWVPAGWWPARVILLWIAWLFLRACVSNYKAYFSAQATTDFERRQRALAITPESVLMESVKGVHPEMVRLIFTERRIAWMVASGNDSPDGKPFSVLAADPMVTDRFVSYFLDNSGGVSVMPMHGFLVEGRINRFDPRGQYDEYTMYRAFVKVLYQWRMITLPYGEKAPGMWIPPHGPATCAAALGWEWAPATDPDPSPAEYRQTGEPTDDGLQQTETMRLSVNGKK